MRPGNGCNVREKSKYSKSNCKFSECTRFQLFIEKAKIGEIRLAQKGNKMCVVDKSGVCHGTTVRQAKIEEIRN